MILALLGLAHAQDLRFPTSAEDHAHFYPTAYYDHAGVDWGCGDIRYSGHRGSDFGVGSFAGMDAGRDVVAAADGVVLSIHDGEWDRCTTGDCSGGSGYGNHVVLEHTDGSTSIYAHLKQWSVAVDAGDPVGCGDELGEVGSSGYSTGPHLHFEPRDHDNVAYDPFRGDCGSTASAWVDQGSYGDLPAGTCWEEADSCEPVASVTCGDEVQARNDAEGSTDAHLDYGCTEWAYTGPEIAYEVRTALDEPVTLSLTGLADDLDLYVVDACDAASCQGASSASDAADESVTFEASAGATYLVVIDGWEGATSDFSLTVSCEGRWVEDSGDSGDGGDSRDTADTTPKGGPEGGRRVPKEPAGCACASGGLGGGWAALIGLAAARRRRR